MTDHGPAIDPRQVASIAMSKAHGNAERREQKQADTHSLLSIAASLVRIGDLLETRPSPPDTLTVLPEVERVAGGCCCQDDDLLEFAFGLICNVDGGSWPQQNDEWKQAARRFIDAYNAKVTAEFGGSVQDDESPDDLLEFAFGLICNVDGFTDANGGSWPQQNDEWKQAARRFIDAYNAKVTAEFGGSVQDQLIQARAELEVMKSRQAREAAEAMLGDDS